MSQNIKTFVRERMSAPLDIPAPQVAKLPMGEMQYAVYGEGKPVLVIHGGGGGYDQGIFLFKHFMPKGYQIISPSRPGYLGTPLSTGQTIDEQADAFAALLDYLNIPNAVIVSISAGGLYLYPFAIRHPKKTKAIIAIDSIAGEYLMPEQSGKCAQALYMSRLGLWLVKKMMYYFPSAIIQNIVKLEGYLTQAQIKTRVKDIKSSPVSLAIITDLMFTMTDYKGRMAGSMNDVNLGAQISWFDFARITCPALIIHGTHDADVKFYHGVFAYERLSSKVKDYAWIEYGTHFGFFFAPSASNAHQKFSEFIVQHG